MEKDEQKKRFNDAVRFHKTLDKRFGYESPNDSWPPFLVEYYNKLEDKKNEKIN